MRTNPRQRLLSMVLGVLLHAATAHGAIVFSTDFESGLPEEFSAPGATIEPVQGFAGHGGEGGTFAGSFLRYASTSVEDTVLTVTGLPPHDHLSLGFLLAVIDSWDGVELLQVTVDGEVRFSNSFELAQSDTSSYDPPHGVLIESGASFGFSTGPFYDHDRCYDMSLEPAFVDIPHTADSVVVVWHLDATPGAGASYWQGGADESWAIDDVTVEVSGGVSTTTTTTTTSTSTTTLPEDACADIPQGPTFPSIACRLARELARVNREAEVGALRPKLTTLLTTALAGVTEARTICAGGDARKAKARLVRVVRSIMRYARRLNGPAARRTLSAGLRIELLGFTDPVRNDVKTLRQQVACPDDATG